MNKTNKDFFNWGSIEPKEKEQENNVEGLLTYLFKDWQFKKQFTKEELAEIKKIKKQSFMREIKRLAKEEGERLAREEFEENKYKSRHKQRNNHK